MAGITKVAGTTKVTGATKVTGTTKAAGAAKVAGSKMLIGAHCKGGLKGAVAHAQQIGANAMQIFIGSPQTWKEPSPALDDIAAFHSSVSQQSLGPVFVHGNYLVNLASSSVENLAKSIDNLSVALRLADRCRAQGLIFHPGSAMKDTYEVALQRVLKALEFVLKDYGGTCKLLLEVCAGQGETIGDRFSEFRDILEAMGNDSRLGVCWDTCHLFNAGYDVSTHSGLEKTLDEFEEYVGMERLYCVHANDSKTPLGARRDRHENIGQGHIGEEAFARMLHHPSLRQLPWILEVPGFDKEGPDKKNIDILKRLAK